MCNNTIHQVVMSYKEQIKKPKKRKERESAENTELLLKLRIIRDVEVYKTERLKVAQKYRCHRNTVGNILKTFTMLVSKERQRQLLGEKSLTREEVVNLLSPLKNGIRKPNGHKYSASKEQENALEYMRQTKRMYIGPKRMYSQIQHMQKRKSKLTSKIFIEHLKELERVTPSQVRGVYRRKKYKTKKVRTKNRESRPLYDYKTIGAFEQLHMDTKTIADQHALPVEVYDKFKHSKELPQIEWNIIDAKTRIRFIAYSFNRSSEFGFHFLSFTLQFIQAHSLIHHNAPIRIGVDNGSEFCKGSAKKEAKWNKCLSVLNTKLYSYDSPKDVRKNLIERSHKTDDEEFFAPRGYFIKTKKDFLKEAQEYYTFFNFDRPHSGIGMNNMTPIEKLESCGVHNANKIREFPTLLLERDITQIRQSTVMVQLTALLENMKKNNILHKLKEQKVVRDIENSFSCFTSCAQNVLTYYHIEMSYPPAI